MAMRYVVVIASCPGDLHWEFLKYDGLSYRQDGRAYGQDGSDAITTTILFSPVNYDKQHQFEAENWQAFWTDHMERNLDRAFNIGLNNKDAFVVLLVAIKKSDNDGHFFCAKERVILEKRFPAMETDESAHEVPARISAALRNGTEKNRDKLVRYAVYTPAGLRDYFEVLGEPL